MRKLTGFLLLGLFALTAINCGGGSGNSPADIEKAIYGEFQKGNIEKGLKVFFENCDETGIQIDSDEFKLFVEKAKYSLGEKGGIKNFEITEVKIDESNETATVFSKITYGNGEVENQDNQYVKVDGKWKTTMGIK